MALIEREPLLAAYDAAHKGQPGGARKLIEQAPEIDAVPLDKLCEWLPSAVNSCPANPEGHNEKCEHMKCEECWKEAICNWMEGWNKHATDTE